MSPQDKPYRVYRGGRVKVESRRFRSRSGRRAATDAVAPRSATPVQGPRSGRKTHWLAPGRAAGARPALHVLDRLDRAGLPVRPPGRQGGERPPGAARGGRPRAAGRPAAHTSERHPAPRHRPRGLPARPQGLSALGLDHAHPHRSRTRSDRLPHDPARPARRGSRLRLREDQLGHADRRARARDPDDSADRPGGQPRRRRQLRRLQGSDRQGRRRDDRRAGPDPLQQVRLPLSDPGALRPLGRLALRQGGSRRWTAAAH